MALAMIHGCGIITSNYLLSARSTRPFSLLFDLRLAGTVWKLWPSVSGAEIVPSFVRSRDSGNFQNKLSSVAAAAAAGGSGSSPPMPPQRSQPLASPRTQRRETTRDFVTARTFQSSSSSDLIWAFFTNFGCITHNSGYMDHVCPG